MLKQRLELKQTQKLSPLQIQTIKLIELPIQELEQRVRKELEENPVLDDGPDPDESQEEREDREERNDQDETEVSIDEMEDDSIPSYKLHVNNKGKDEEPRYNTFSVKEGFTESLMRQLGFKHLDSKQYQIAAFIVGSLDDDGYLRRDLESIVDDLAFRANIETSYEEVESLLHVVQQFEPAGVAARDLRECLLLQLRPSPENRNKPESREVLDARLILKDYFTEFSNKHFHKILTGTGMDEERLKSAMNKILKLNPAPGGQIDDSYDDQAQQIVPDFVLTYEHGILDFYMPRFNLPELHVNRKYARILRESKGTKNKQKKDAATFVKSKIDSAKWFIEALRQRYNTLDSTMQAILDFQHDYFIDGDERNLKPMVLKDIAAITGFDISTISRVVNSKYIETHFGIYPLKYFFSEGMENKDGEEVSTRELKMALQHCVDNENKRKPFTDDQLVKELGAKGYKVARRTIAKYRDQLGIPKSRLRKEL